MNSSLLKIYYDRFFPSSKLFKWLKINQYREISFNLEGGIFLRYQICRNHEEFAEKIKTFSPDKIDVGGIYDVKPEKNKIKKCVKKELVFDIDLTDYERNCCKDKNICERCIPLIKVSVELLDYILREELGFKILSFVFSGRRGLHCWVRDEFTLTFSEQVRGDIVSYIENVISASKYTDEYTRILQKYIFYIKDQGFIKDCDLSIDLKDTVFLKVLYEKMFLKIDREVTKSFTHLIKMPFCVHPSSQMLSLPIDPKRLDMFSLESMVTLKEVMNNPDKLLPAIKILDEWNRALNQNF